MNEGKTYLKLQKILEIFRQLIGQFIGNWRKMKPLLKVTKSYLKKSIPTLSSTTTQNSTTRTFFKNTLKLSENYYDILGVSQSSDEKEIKSAYKKKALKYHQDRNPDGKKERKKKFLKKSFLHFFYRCRRI